jgi:excisionase family DNA binding protein
MAPLEPKSTNQTNEPPFFTPKQLAERWNLCELTLRRWHREGRIRRLNLGRSVRFSREEVLRVEREAVV